MDVESARNCSLDSICIIGVESGGLQDEEEHYRGLWRIIELGVWVLCMCTDPEIASIFSIQTKYSSICVFS